METLVVAAAPAVLRAMICSVRLWLMKNGKCGTTIDPSKRPTPVFGRFQPYPPMRISTLPTFDEVKMVSLTVSPTLGESELNETYRICGAASGGSIKIVGVGTGVGGGGVGEGTNDGAGDPEAKGVTEAAGAVAGGG